MMQMDFRALYNMSTNTPYASYNTYIYNKFLNPLPTLRAVYNMWIVDGPLCTVLIGIDFIMSALYC